MAQKIKTVVFDLDGTIYQNNEFIRDYIHVLLEGSGRESWEDALVDYIGEVFHGRHLVMNDYYTSVVLPAASLPAYFTALAALRREDMDYHTAVDSSDVVYLGDAWAVVALVGKTLGLLEGDRGNEVYRKVRAIMSEQGMTGDPVLKESIRALGEHVETILLTNSFEATALDFLHQLDFDGIFNKIVFSANKPFGLVEHLAAATDTLKEAPGALLTIGDHAFNDLMPLEALGCQSLWINPFTGIHEPHYNYAVRSTGELAGFLDGLRAQ